MSCVCVKNGRNCSECWPLRRGTCENANLGLPNVIPCCEEEETNPTEVEETIDERNEIPAERPEQPDIEIALPRYVEMPDGPIRWNGSLIGDGFQEELKQAYNEVIRWRRNLFMVPSGKVGETFVGEMARMFKMYGESTTLEPISLMAAMTMPALLLQKPHQRSKSKDHIKCLENRLQLWKDGNLSNLLSEGRCIQRRLQGSKRGKNEHDKLASTFSKLMRKGKVKAALRLLTNQEGMILNVNSPLNKEGGNDRTVLDELKTKHPPKGPVCKEALLEDCGNEFHPIIFDSIDGDTIQRAALNTNGAAGPSGIDADGWKRMCTSFKHESTNLCNSLAVVAKKLSTTYVDPKGLSEFTASRLIAIDKQPGVRPIAIGEVSRRIISKAIMMVIKKDVMEAAGSIQLCTGLTDGCVAAVHSMKIIFENDCTQAALLVDAQNAFNLLNRRVALWNIHQICPSIATILTNIYREDASLFVQDETILSQEGVMQGDPMAMAMFALGIAPLIKELQGIHQIWFADDAAAGGSLDELHHWWTKLIEIGPRYGYYPNPGKTWLLVKEEGHMEAQSLFAQSGVNITSSGQKHLGAALGNLEFTTKFIETKVKEWTREVEVLSEFGRRDPHSAYAAVTHGLISKWLYLMRTIPNINQSLKPLEEEIRHKLIPAIIGRSDITNEERSLLALPCRLGGMGLINPMEISDDQYHSSRDITAPLINLILEKKMEMTENVENEMRQAKANVKRRKRVKQEESSTNIKMSDRLKRHVEFAKEKGSSIWLTTLPVEKNGFALQRSEFKDAVSLRYGWLPDRLPLKCACSTPFSVEHALSCPKGAFPTHRHNELRDITASLLSEVCTDVSIEPELQPVDGMIARYASSNTANDARSDIRARGFWGSKYECAFFDVKVFNPNAPSYRKTSVSACYSNQERIKKRGYEQRINEIEHGSFTPLIFSTSGGMGKSATVFYKRLAAMISEKRRQPYAHTMRWLRCQLNFSLLRSSIICIRGSRARRFPNTPDSLLLATRESKI